MNHHIQGAPCTISNVPTPEILQFINEMDFGVARKDLEKVGTKFEWIKEEIEYLQHYIQFIEKETDHKNRYAICLQHIKIDASVDIKKYFHPHHIASSDRLKNGYNSALKKLSI